jgi:protein-S-isoprenylcysteine O-methyltransferase Ste14
MVTGHDARLGDDLRALPLHLTLALLDLVERGAVLALFVVFVMRVAPRLSQLVTVQLADPALILAAATINAQALLLIVAETLGVVLIMLRPRSPTLSLHPADWLLGLSAVSLPLLVVPAAPNAVVPAAVTTSLMLIGLALQIYAKLALWRSFGIVPANRGVKVGGPYRVVRHPMYAGYTLTHIGFLLGFPLLQNLLLYGAVFAVQIARLLREERMLRHDPRYRHYAAAVRYRLLPGIF